ncbi:hypothetical protein V8G54_002230 [Vigna mungo]|uniref:Uncharacterized protein n=1 Tax=Vigna mungo TaxID=3915 RepID=A0AAQ3SCA0_VIGMU
MSRLRCFVFHLHQNFVLLTFFHLHLRRLLHLQPLHLNFSIFVTLCHFTIMLSDGVFKELVIHSLRVLPFPSPNLRVSLFLLRLDFSILTVLLHFELADVAFGVFDLHKVESDLDRSHLLLHGFLDGVNNFLRREIPQSLGHLRSLQYLCLQPMGP